MVERTIAWLTRGNRKVRYRGTAKNDHWLHQRATALNLRRLITLGLTNTGTTWAIAQHQHHQTLPHDPPECHAHHGGVTSSANPRVWLHLSATRRREAPRPKHP
jgi:hypothetical protein